ncbi:regulator of microtubule dynamics protein 1 [Halyomorpha halys]|uniref:regulator of microtubule dynamics protein 1 n=1 Tax=Halyomorpha halys TaxID=286706 RepID=UPI0006D51D5A|nr:regulator of microtubule dynamics protein 1-like [Halyomorpha halys]
MLPSKGRGLFYLAYSGLKLLKPVAVQTFNRQKLLCNRNKYSAGVFLVSLSIFTSNIKPDDPVEENELEEEIKVKIKEADLLYKQNKYKEVYDLLKQYEESSEVEVLWRLSRVLYNMSQEHDMKPDEKKALIFESFDIISRSLALDETNFANHKWMSILLDARTAYDGIKARISHLDSVKNHMLKAVELNPKDATTLYMLGLWCYQITDMPWYQRKIASTVFAAPPVSSYEEALDYFIKAEEIEPRFYSQNLLMLGKTYLKLKKEDKARYYLDLACHYPIATDDDHLANKEACELLKKFKAIKK